MRPSEWWIVGGINAAAIGAASVLLIGLLQGLITVQ